ncbi:hypothetical protein FBU31_007001, partial [Coemansia sp. 'formosensis']
GAFGGATQVSPLDSLPAALANIVSAPDAVTETIVYEEGDQGLQSTAVDPAVAAAVAEDDDDDDDEEDEYHNQGDFHDEDVNNYEDDDDDF